MQAYTSFLLFEANPSTILFSNKSLGKDKMFDYVFCLHAQYYNKFKVFLVCLGYFITCDTFQFYLACLWYFIPCMVFYDISWTFYTLHHFWLAWPIIYSVWVSSCVAVYALSSATSEINYISPTWHSEPLSVMVLKFNVQNLFLEQ